MHRRRGGSATNILVGITILFLVLTSLYYYWRSQVQPIAGTSTTSVTSSGTSTSWWSLTSTASSHLQNITLADLKNLSFTDSSQCSGLLDPHWWDTSIQASGKTTVNIIPSTAYSLPRSYTGWATYLRENTTYTGLDKYAFDFMTRLAAQVMGTHDMTKAAAMVQNYTAYVAAAPVTAADYVSFGGLSAIRVYGDTGNLTQAAAQTFPAQVYQLFALSQDCSYSEEQRAQFFGTAMAMSLFILATSGKDGFGPKFEGMLDQLGLRDAWAGMKSSVKEIMDVSPGASYQTVMVMSALAKKFPGARVGDLTSYTSSRIAYMVKVLNDQGFSSDEIAQKVADLNQAVDESNDEGHVADLANAISYQAQGFLHAKIDSKLTPYLSSEGNAPPRYLTASFLALVLPDFKVGDATALKVTVHKFWHALDTQLTSYEAYTGGTYVTFTLPKEEVQPGDEVGLSLEILPVEDFASSIPPVTLNGKIVWGSNGALLKNLKAADGVFQFSLLQDNPWWNGGEVTIQGQIVKYPGVSNQLGGIYAEFAMTDYVRRSTNLRVHYDGFTLQGAGLQIVRAGEAYPVSVVSYDGSRLQFVYGSNNKVATIYVNPPSESMYILSPKHTYSGPYLDLVQGKYIQAWQIDKVVMVRDLENEMLKRGSSYVVGRIGGEISYVALDKQIGLQNIVIEEPSMGGRDLHTLDNTVAVQARFLKDFEGADRQTKIEQALRNLAEKLQEDYRNQPQMIDGYAILSYVDTDGTVKTIILEVPKW